MRGVRVRFCGLLHPWCPEVWSIQISPSIILLLLSYLIIIISVIIVVKKQSTRHGALVMNVCMFSVCVVCVFVFF